MINTLSFSYPWWYTLICLSLGVLYGLLMYYRDKRFSDYSPWLTRFLTLVRSVTVFLILLLLLSPFVKTIKEDIKTPVILFASDISESIKETAKAGDLTLWQSNLDNLEKIYHQNLKSGILLLVLMSILKKKIALLIRVPTSAVCSDILTKTIVTKIWEPWC
ncbi:MAG: hypothetical protein IPO98_10410 [Saprospiraceae bacterium]|nr:hypothetical protein [Saprospiraceae bacterium]